MKENISQKYDKSYTYLKYILSVCSATHAFNVLKNTCKNLERQK